MAVTEVERDTETGSPWQGESKVSVHNEWDPLEEVVVGVADGARIPRPDRGLYAIDYADVYARPGDIPSGPYDPQVIAEANEDLEGLKKALEREGVTVRRPRASDHGRTFGTPEWTSDGEYNYCPRDVLLFVGDLMIETPMTLRSRYFEPFAYRDLLVEYFRSGARWVSAPKPELRDETYAIRPADGRYIGEAEPIFDAANVLRLGEDLLYLVSRSGNYLGLEWLRRTLGPDYRVHAVEGVYDGTHIDSTITPIRPGLVLLNPERVKQDAVPDIFKSWDIIWAPDMVDTARPGFYPRGSVWQGMNFFMVRPDLAVIDAQQTDLIRAVEKHGVDVLALNVRHARTLSGGFHCVTLDVRRRGGLEDYR